MKDYVVMFAWSAERSADESEEPSPVCGGAHRDRSEDSLEEEALTAGREEGIFSIWEPSRGGPTIHHRRLLLLCSMYDDRLSSVPRPPPPPL